MSSDELIPRQRLLTMQIIAGALPTGVIVFFGVVMFLVYGQGGPPRAQPQSLPIISMMAGGFLVITGAMSFILPQLMTQAALKQRAAGPEASDGEGLLGTCQTALIVGLALLEGPAFFALVAFLVERESLVLIVPGLALLGMLTRFPTENSIRTWMEMNGRRLQELRQDRPGAA